MTLATSARTKTKYGGFFPFPFGCAQDDGKNKQRQKQIPPLRCGMTNLDLRRMLNRKSERVSLGLLCHDLFTRLFHICVTIEVVAFSDEESSIMPRINFHLQLAELKDKLLAMAALSQQALEFSVEGYLERDMALCEHVLEIEEAINTAETVVDEMAYELLAKEQPMAIDLRFILSVIKINSDLERIGDQAANIAERALALKDEPVIELPVDIQEMGESAGVMIRTSIQALLEADARMADSVLSMDDAVDEANKAVQAELMEVMQQKPEVSTQAITAILVARNLERAADHATNIAEDVIFWLRGSDVRHKFSLAEAE